MNRFLSYKNIILIKIYTFSFCCLILIPLSCLGNEYYVSTSGNNQNDGSILKPFKSINFGQTKLKAGDILYVRNGTYNERVSIYSYTGISGNTANPIIIMAYPGEKPTIDGTGLEFPEGSGLVMIWRDFVQFVGFKIINSNPTGQNGTGGSGIIGIGRNYIIKECTVQNCWQYGICALGDYGIVEDCNVSNTALSNFDGIYSQGEIWAGGITARHNSVQTYAKRIKIRNNKVYDSWGEGISIAFCDSINIEGNTIYDSYSVALYVRNSQNNLIHRNLVYSTKEMGDGSRVGIGYWNEGNDSYINRNNAFINNFIYRCKRNFYSDCTLVDLLVANNTFVNSSYFSCVQISDKLASNSAFKNNIILQEDDLSCIYLSPKAGIQFSNNLFNKSYDSDAVGNGDIIQDPKLSKFGEKTAGNLTGSYFKLLSNSPAINAGIKINSILSDFFNNSRDENPDIGAHEYTTQIPVTDIKISGFAGCNSISRDKGTLQLETQITPSVATDKLVTWSLINFTGQATINQSGIVTAISNGTVTAKATANDGSGVFGTMEITISNQLVTVKSITVSSETGSSSINANRGTIQLSATVLPSDAVNKTISWSVQNGTGKASISASGLLTAISNGTITATATANDGSGVSGSLQVNIMNQVFPTIQTAYVENANPSLITLSFDNQLATVPANISALSVKINHSTIRQVATLAVTGNKIVLGFNLPFYAGETITISYIKPASNPITSPDGGECNSFSDFTVTNKIEDTGPIFLNASIDNDSPSTLVITYNEELNNSAPGLSAFLVTVNNQPVVVTSVTISDNKVILQIEKRVIFGDIITVSYTKPSINQLRKASGGVAVSIGPQAVLNKVADIRESISKEKGIRIYPNPAVDVINIALKEATMQPEILRIFDQSGKICHEAQLGAFSTNYRIELNLKKGLYIVQLVKGKITSLTEKLIIM